MAPRLTKPIPIIFTCLNSGWILQVSLQTLFHKNFQVNSRDKEIEKLCQNRSYSTNQRNKTFCQLEVGFI